MNDIHWIHKRKWLIENEMNETYEDKKKTSSYKQDIKIVSVSVFYWIFCTKPKREKKLLKETKEVYNIFFYNKIFLVFYKRKKLSNQMKRINFLSFNEKWIKLWNI